MQNRNILAGGLAGVLAASAVLVPVQAQTAQAQGEVVRVDVAAGKITLRHGAIPGLDLPAMTLVYRADPALLQGVSPGDKVSFTAQRADNQYLITALKK